MFIETETTPNPATLKFLPGQRVMPSGTRDFASPEEAEASPLAQALFDTGEVTGVLLGADFVAVTAGPGADWGTLKAQVVAVLLDHFISQTPLFVTTSNGIAVPSEASEGELLYPDDPEQADIVEQIKELIETRVRPAVANDGGDIRYRGFHEGVVYLQMQGACSGCPSSTATLKQGIEGLLKHYVPEVTEVRAA
ncbi:MAG: NifU family protein [Alteraurantiacibacter sp.]